MKEGRWRSWGVLGLSLVAWSFIWTYLRKSMYDTVLNGTTLGQSAYPLLVTLTIGFVAWLSFSKGTQRGFFERPWLVAGCSLLGSACIIVFGSHFSMQLERASVVISIVCLFLWAAAFAIVYSAWLKVAWFHSFKFGIEIEILVQIGAASLSFFATSGFEDGSARVGGLYVLGLGASGILYATMGYIGGVPARGIESRVAAASGKGPRAELPWLALLGFSLLSVGMLGYAHYFDDAFIGLGAYGFAVDALTFATLIIMALLSVYSNRRKARQRRLPLMLALGLLFSAFVAFFVIMVALATEGGLSYGFARFIRRMARVAAFLTVLVMVYQRGMRPLGAFAVAFFIPSMIPKPLQMTLSSDELGLLGAVGRDYTMVALATTGFVMTAFLIVFCLLNIDGRLARRFSEDQETEVAGDEMSLGQATGNKEEAYERLRADYGLTCRETDVLRLFSQGASAQKTAAELYISVNTVNTHAMALYRKLGIHSKHELMEVVGVRSR